MALRLRYTDVRTRTDQRGLRVGIRHVAVDEDGRAVKTDWIEMSRDDASAIVRAMQEALAEGPLEQSAGLEGD